MPREIELSWQEFVDMIAQLHDIPFERAEAKIETFLQERKEGGRCGSSNLKARGRGRRGV